ncbi:MAG: hypothetical protein V1808_00120 [Candidatus Daviesbacteria bacterium]
MGLESGRRYLSPSILRIVDNLGISYKDMQPGQSLTIYAEDAATRRPGSFNLEVLSVRNLDDRRDIMTATLRYREGDFSFYNGENSAAKPVRLKEGTLMENGISGILIPQTDARMAYFGGIGLGRDHSFEYVDGDGKSVIVHRLTTIDIGNPLIDWEQPDLIEYLQKLEATKTRQAQEREKAKQESEREVEAFIEKKFQDHLLLGQIQERLKEFSPNGKNVIASYLAYALEDGVIDKAWEVFEKACDDHYSYQPPYIRGDVEVLGQNRTKLMEMTTEAGIKWPRPTQETEESDQDSPEVGEIPNIEIPSDVELQTKLQRKLAEYQGRFTNQRSSVVIDARHKAAVLDELLAKGEVSVDSLRSRLSKEPWFNEDNFDDAVWIINEYCRAGGPGRAVGGTGLR